MNPLTQARKRYEAARNAAWAYPWPLLLPLSDHPEDDVRRALLGALDQTERDYEALKRAAGLRHGTSIHAHRGRKTAGK